MYDKLNGIIVKQTEALNNLLGLLEEQYDYIVKEDAFKMEGIIDSIRDASVEVAKIEMERRALTAGRAISEIVMEANNSVLENSYREIRRVINAVTLQKETNELLIKQGIGYTTKMLEIINPSRKEAKTYGATGKVKR